MRQSVPRRSRRQRPFLKNRPAKLARVQEAEAGSRGSLDYVELARKRFETTGNYGALLWALFHLKSQKQCPRWLVEALSKTLLGWMFGSEFRRYEADRTSTVPVLPPPAWYKRWCRDQVDFWRAYYVEEGRTMGLTDRDARGYASLILAGRSLVGAYKLPAGGDPETMKKSYQRVRRLVARGEDYCFNVAPGLEFVSKDLAIANRSTPIQLAYLDRMVPDASFVPEIDFTQDNVVNCQRSIEEQLKPLPTLCWARASETPG